MENFFLLLMATGWQVFNLQIMSTVTDVTLKQQVHKIRLMTKRGKACCLATK